MEIKCAKLMEVVMSVSGSNEGVHNFEGIQTPPSETTQKTAAPQSGTSHEGIKFTKGAAQGFQIQYRPGLNESVDDYNTRIQGFAKSLNDKSITNQTVTISAEDRAHYTTLAKSETRDFNKIPGDDQRGVLLALLRDDLKNPSSFGIGDNYIQKLKALDGKASTDGAKALSGKSSNESFNNALNKTAVVFKSLLSSIFQFSNALLSKVKAEASYANESVQRSLSEMGENIKTLKKDVSENIKESKAAKEPNKPITITNADRARYAKLAKLETRDFDKIPVDDQRGQLLALLRDELKNPSAFGDNYILKLIQHDQRKKA